MPEVTPRESIETAPKPSNQHRAVTYALKASPELADVDVAGVGSFEFKVLRSGGEGGVIILGYDNATSEPEVEGLLRSYVVLLRSAKALGAALSSVKVDASPQMARAVQARETFYTRIEREYGLLTAREAGRRMGSTSPRPGNAASQARKDGRLVALERGQRLLFPGWQFDDDGHPIKAVRRLVALAEERGLNERSVIEWVSAPSAHFGDSAPAAYLNDDPDAVVEGAAALWGVEW